MTITHLVSPASVAAAVVRTSVHVPVRFVDGFVGAADVHTFRHLVDGREHLALGLGDWRAAVEPSCAGAVPTATQGCCGCGCSDQAGQPRNSASSAVSSR